MNIIKLNEIKNRLLKEKEIYIEDMKSEEILSELLNLKLILKSH